MDTLTAALTEAMRSYCGRQFNGYSSLATDSSTQGYAVIFYPSEAAPRTGGIVMIARIAQDTIIIERDQTNKPLVDMLLQMGVPRQKIILAYAGEPVPPELDVLPVTTTSR